MEFIQSCLIFFSRFHVEMWLCSSLFIFCCEKRKFFWLRYILVTTVFISLPYLLPKMEGDTIYYWSYLKVGDWVNFSWFIFYLLDMAALLFLFRFNTKEILFHGSASYTMQHLMKRFIFLICNIFSIQIGRGNLIYYLLSTALLFPILFAYYWFFIRRINHGEHININNIYIIIISAVTVALYCFLSSYDDLYSQGNISLRITTTITDILILTLLFGLFEKSKSVREREEMSKILHEKQEDLIFSKKNIELINMKAHNLKHQIESLRSIPENEKNQHLNEIEQEINFYDNVAKTKNEPLNVILTKKSLYCQKHAILFNYMVDDEPLSTLDDVDLYSIMGNILDNAIEALLKVNDKDKRIIYLTIKRKGSFLVIHESNFFGGKLKLKNGLPSTSKDDKDNHGIGLKSVRYLAEKYKGNMTIDVTNEMFNINILIPL